MRNRYLHYILILVAGLILGWLLFHHPHEKSVSSETQLSEEKATIWTCSMHPQIKMDHPGKCPICGMDLIPLGQNGGGQSDSDAVHFSREAAALANVMTSVAGKQKPVKEIRLYGKVQVDERLLQSQVAHVTGRIERLNVNFTGEIVKRGQVLAEIYSPVLITAQEELIQSAETKQSQPELYEASRERLRQWKLSDEQINEIETSGKTVSSFRVLSNSTGTVINRLVNTGDYVSQGMVLFEIADLSGVWVQFEAYESDLPFLEKGRKVSFTLQSVPGKEYSGNIAFIDPVIDPVTRTARIRVEVSNRSGDLKPEMFVTGIVTADLSQYSNDIVIPRSAVLWTGKRSVVYVKQPGEDYIFKMRLVELGPMLGDSYVITSGLSEGEEIVTSGAFSVDAAAQLEGKPSMMNPADNNASGGHLHEKVQGSGKSSSLDNKKEVNTLFKKQLSVVYEGYLSLKEAFIESDPVKTKTEALKVGAAIAVDMKQLSGKLHTKWMEILADLEKNLKTISGSDDLVLQRAAFSDLSDQLYSALTTFGLENKTVYLQFCPMAFNNKGAHWLSQSAEIRNPYFGKEMLTCGETRETMKF